MSPTDQVTRTGPDGYELQHDVTAWLDPEASAGKLFVETEDGEDAELTVESDPQVERVEMEVTSRCSRRTENRDSVKLLVSADRDLDRAFDRRVR